MSLLVTVWDIFIHLDRYLNSWADVLGPWLYVVLFLVIFAETGLVVAPYLPGDSLLFAVGALAAREGSPINLPLMCVLLTVAAVIGDAVNYSVGHWVGPKIFDKEDSLLFDKKHLLRAHQFYEKYGGKTIFLARFVPIVRTFAPFVAGIGEMSYLRFAAYNVTGGITWTCAFLISGYYFSNLPIVKQQFHLVIAAIIVISVIPIAVEYLKAKPWRAS